MNTKLVRCVCVELHATVKYPLHVVLCAAMVITEVVSDGVCWGCGLYFRFITFFSLFLKVTRSIAQPAVKSSTTCVLVCLCVCLRLCLFSLPLSLSF